MNEYQEQAEKFLKNTGTELSVEFNRFGSMLWDTNGTERNIFDVTIKNSRGSHTLEFGDSIANSCKETPKIESDEPVEIYTGYKFGANDGNLTGTIWGFKINTHYSDLRKIRDGEMTESDLINWDRLKDKLREDFRSIEKRIRANRYIQLRHANDIMNRTVRKWAGPINQSWFARHKSPLENEDWITVNALKESVVAHWIKHNIAKAVEKAKKDTTLLDQADKIVKPTAYDILTCLTVCYAETFEEFCAEYGYSDDSIKALQTWEAVKEESQALRDMYTEDELEMLQDIV